MGSVAPATRRTAQKEAIRRALDASSGFVSAQQVHRLLQDAGTPVGMATVYRQLNALTESGAADTVTGPEGQLFRTCAADGHHHHHLICENCGKAELLEPNETWIRAAARDHGYTVTRHILEVFGLCRDCAALGARPGVASEARGSVD